MVMLNKQKDSLGKKIRNNPNVLLESSIGLDIIPMNMLVMKSDWSLHL
jgi:hypothetical protein